MKFYELPNSPMKFYETIDSEYYALIKAYSEEQALEIYVQDVCSDLPTFREVDKNYTLSKFVAMPNAVAYEDWNVEVEKFKKWVFEEDDLPMTVLVDGDLI